MFVSSTSTSRLNDAHVGERQQHGAGVVHRADDRGLAFLNVPARHDAVDGRLDAHLAQIVARALEAGALLVDSRFLRVDLPLAFLERRFRGADVVLRALERFARRELLLPELLLAREVLLRLIELHARGLDRLPLLLERRSRRRVSDAVPLSTRVRSRRGSICSRNWPLVDAVAFVDGQIDDAAGRFGG